MLRSHSSCGRSQTHQNSRDSGCIETALCCAVQNGGLTAIGEPEAHFQHITNDRLWRFPVPVVRSKSRRPLLILSWPIRRASGRCPVSPRDQLRALGRKWHLRSRWLVRGHPCEHVLDAHAVFHPGARTWRGMGSRRKKAGFRLSSKVKVTGAMGAGGHSTNEKMPSRRARTRLWAARCRQIRNATENGTSSRFFYGSRKA
jgi:hypothetical protein